MDEIIPHPPKGARSTDKELIVVTGSSGRIGYGLIKRLAENYRVVGLDRVGPPYPPKEAECVNFDITDEEAIDSAMERIRYGYGSKISSVVHLAAYYSFNTKESPGYEEINEKGTHKLLRQLQDFEVEQFIYSSTNLLYKPQDPGTKVHEDCPVEPHWAYPRSKLHTEEFIRKYNQAIPAVFLRVAGVYTDWCHSIPLSQQIKRIYEEDLISHFYSGDLNHGSVFVHLDDVLDAIIRTIERREAIPDETPINIGEPVTPSYQELQDKIGKLIHGKKWKTYEMPEGLAKAGAWMRDLFGDPFIKPWMIDRADDHYEYDINRAEKMLGWKPKHALMDTLPTMISHLKDDPEKWYKENNLE
ncbi:NAD(P)-dependent oxidoreductase [Membranicola marinus]|uniref:NAD(P)-dependent oxidoreductase n=1 Tax=Membranihabitans marinus TaxID=1227546 RepID=A0A953HN90_9BACT|nr:NAD(P)-dependent oxidoreductase [Membranihabitans marinus]MBY5959094.1 NAD(P)-dependent oxidoreductase [Membranihabitans marinus]